MFIGVRNMVRFKKGFTLLELLIAAAIIGVLAMFATQAFRRSSAEVRVQDTRNRVDALGAALTRFLVDYPSYRSSLLAGTLAEVPATGGTCVPSAITGQDGEGNSYVLSTLADCGYLERRSYLNGNFVWTVTADGQICASAVEGGKVSAYWGDTYCSDGFTNNGK